jgi:hypothetical protein
MLLAAPALHVNRQVTKMVPEFGIILLFQLALIFVAINNS